ncbi:MAG: hypothetical protein ACJA2S_001271 [Cyclobacteriaceae bacterium]
MDKTQNRSYISVVNDVMTMQQTCVEGKIMDTFEKYYHEKVKVIEITTGEM